MTFLLRVLLIAVSLITFLFISKKVRDSKVRLEDSLFWFIFALLLLILSIFPQVFDFLATMTGVQSTSNFVFLFFIFVLLIKCFTMSMRISQLDTKTKELAQSLALETARLKSTSPESRGTVDTSIAGQSDERRSEI